jgi:hypothetical protein
MRVINPDVYIAAAAQVGGGIALQAGSGTSINPSNGGDGGAVQVRGGQGMGGKPNIDIGGMIHLEGGTSRTSTGGKIELFSGTGTTSSSGDMALMTVDAGKKGDSGTLQLQTGNSTTSGTSGSLLLVTGGSRPGPAGDIIVSVGSGFLGNGGRVAVTAGDMTDMRSTGGAVDIAGGQGVNRNGVNGGKGGPVNVVGGYAGGQSGGDVGKRKLGKHSDGAYVLTLLACRAQVEQFLFKAAKPTKGVAVLLISFPVSQSISRVAILRSAQKTLRPTVLVETSTSEPAKARWATRAATASAQAIPIEAAVAVSTLPLVTVLRKLVET